MTAPALAAQIQGQGVVSADNLNTYAQTCDNVQQLRSFIGLPGIEVLIRGLATPNDGGAGAFYWDQSATGPDDGVNVIIPTGASGGGWIRLAEFAFQSIVTVTDYTALRNVNTIPSPDITVVYCPVSDQSGGIFAWNPSSTTADNGVTIIAPNDSIGPGRWIMDLGLPWSQTGPAGNIYTTTEYVGVLGTPNPNPPPDAQGVLTIYPASPSLGGAFCPTGFGTTSGTVHFYYAAGTIAAPTNPLSGAGMMAIAARPYFNGAYIGSVVAIESNLTESVTTSPYPGAFLNFQTAPTGLGTRNIDMTIHGGQVGINTQQNSVSQGGNTLKIVSTDTDSMLNLQSLSGGTAVYTGAGSQTYTSGENAANAALYVRKDSSTSRSINAAGTVNASGADYADYETKSSDCGDIAKGALVGFDADGYLTDKWSKAISFGVKSTDPSYVGGDCYGSSVGAAPEHPMEPTHPPSLQHGRDFTDEKTHQAAISAREIKMTKWREDRKGFDAAIPVWRAKMETFRAAVASARGPVDRIAKAGKVPCIVDGAVKVGGYIVAQQGPNDSIIGVCQGRPFEASTVGRVRTASPSQDRIYRLISPAVTYNPAWNAIIDVIQS